MSKLLFSRPPYNCSAGACGSSGYKRGERSRARPPHLCTNDLLRRDRRWLLAGEVHVREVHDRGHRDEKHRRTNDESGDASLQIAFLRWGHFVSSWFGALGNTNGRHRVVLRDLLEHVYTLRDLAEHGVDAVQMLRAVLIEH